MTNQVPDLPGALCAQVDSELFYPTADTPGWRQIRLDAKAICGRCDEQAPCLSWALTTDEGYGIWGGLDTSERNVLARGIVTGRPVRPPRVPSMTRDAIAHRSYAARKAAGLVETAVERSKRAADLHAEVRRLHATGKARQLIAEQVGINRDSVNRILRAAA